VEVSTPLHALQRYRELLDLSLASLEDRTARLSLARYEELHDLSPRSRRASTEKNHEAIAVAEGCHHDVA
jgi:hypothetical protein